MLIINSILMGFVCGAWAFMWCRVLTAPGMLGNIVPTGYWRLLGTPVKWKEQLSKPLFDCPVCHSFWVTLALLAASQINAILLVFCSISSALFFAYALDKKYGQ